MTSTTKENNTDGSQTVGSTVKLAETTRSIIPYKSDIEHDNNPCSTLAYETDMTVDNSPLDKNIEDLEMNSLVNRTNLEPRIKNISTKNVLEGLKIADTSLTPRLMKY